MLLLKYIPRHMKEEGMNKLLKASLFLVFFVSFQNHLFAQDLNCEFKGDKMEGIKSIRINDESLIINKELEIPLDKSRVKCGNFGRQIRFDGMALGYQVVLESCTTEAKFEGNLIDSVNEVAARVLCHQVKI